MRQPFSLSVPVTSSRMRDLAALVRERVGEERLLDTAASLTFSTLLALVPLVTIGLTVFSAFPVFASCTACLRIRIDSSIAPRSTGYGTPSFPPYAKEYLTGSFQLGFSP